MATLRQKVMGMFMGGAVGDGLGMPVEKKTAEEIKKRYGRVTTYLPPGEDHKWHKNLKKGMWTDDTQLTLATAEGLMLANGFFMPDIAKAHVAALEGSVSGWGKSTRKAVERLKQGVPWNEAAPTGPGYGEGNGVVMKIAPLAAYLHVNEFAVEDRVRMIRDFTFMTHKTPVALSASLAHVAAIHYCLRQDPNQFKSIECLREIVIATVVPGTDFRFAGRLGTVCSLSPDEREGMLRKVEESPFHVLHSVPLCYAIFVDSPTNFDCVGNAVAAGGDTDTNASIVGALFGALNGIDAIPVEFILGLHDNEKVLEVANRFCDAFIGKEE